MKKLLFILLVISSCETVIDLEIPPHDSVLVLNGILSNDTNVRVSLSNSVGAFEDNQISSINDAIVLFYENDIFLDTMNVLGPDTLWVDGEGYNNNIFHYYLDYYPKTGFEYRIEVKHESYNDISATTTIPEDINIFDISVIDNSLDSNYLEATLNFSFNDDPDKKDYYNLSLYVQSAYYYDEYYDDWVFDPYYEKRYQIEFASNDPSFPGLIPWEGYTYYGREVLFNDELFDGMQKDITLDFDFKVSLLDSLFLNFTSYSQGAYEYFESYESQDNRGFLGPFGGEPIPVYSNVQNGLGILASYNMQSDLLLP